MKSCIERLLKDTDNLGFMVSVLNDTDRCYVRGNDIQVHLENQENFSCLRQLDSSLMETIDIVQNSSLIKQCSKEWHSLHSSAHITGSTLYKGNGMGTLKEQRSI